MRQGVGNAISIMGSRPTSNNFMIDGTANVDTSLGTPAAILSVDIIQEFKEQTATYSAEYGFSANQINIVSKSGTNAFHGSAFHFIRNEKLDARNFFDPADAPKPEARSEAARLLRRRPRAPAVLRRPQQDVLPVQLRGGAHRARVELVLHGPVTRRAGRTFHDDHHRSDDRPAVPEQHHPAGSLVAPRAPGRAVVPGAEYERRAGQLPAGADAAAERRISSRSAAIRIWASSDGRSSADHEDDVRQPDRQQTCRRSAIACSCRTRPTGRSSTRWRWRANLVNQLPVRPRRRPAPTRRASRARSRTSTRSS